MRSLTVAALAPNVAAAGSAGSRGGGRGAFTLTDPNGRIVWAQELPGDYEPEAGDEDRWEARRRVLAHGAILPTAGGGRFAV